MDGPVRSGRVVKGDGLTMSLVLQGQCPFRPGSDSAQIGVARSLEAARAAKRRRSWATGGVGGGG